MKCCIRNNDHFCRFNVLTVANSSANSSSLLNFNEASYDLELATGSEFPIVTRLLEGNVKLSKNITLGSF